jgi:hypothetical protein
MVMIVVVSVTISETFSCTEELQDLSIVKVIDNKRTILTSKRCEHIVVWPVIPNDDRLELRFVSENVMEVKVYTRDSNV